MIRFERVSYRYPGSETLALDGVDLEIAPGERVAVSGPSGSGKSTLLRLMNGLLLPSSGSVTVGGVDTRRDESTWDVRRRVGLVFQNPDNQLVSTTVERELAFGPENLGIASDGIRSRIESLVREFSLAELLGRAPHTLSGGEKQRVAIAAVLAMEPDVLALDEPTSLLDGRGRAEVLSVLDRLSADGGRAVVHVTQFPEELAIAPRALVLSAGRVVYDGTPSGLFNRGAELAGWGLEQPRAAVVADELRSGGLDLPGGLLTLDGLLAALASLGE